MALKTCRCCCAQLPLEKAVKIIAIIFTIMGLISMVMEAVKLGQVDAAIDVVGSNASLVDQAMVIHHNLSRTAILQDLGYAHKLLLVRLCVAILFTVFSLILVAGVFKENQCLVLTFLVFYVLQLTVTTIGNFYAFYDPTVFIDGSALDGISLQNSDMVKIVIYVSLAITLAVIVFFWYLAAVIYSYYKQLARGAGLHEHRQMSQY